MSELALTLLRLGFLMLLWVGIFQTLNVLRRDLRAPREARPTTGPPVTSGPSRKSGRSSAKGSRLVITEGPLAGTVVPLGSATVTIGRAPDSTLVLDDDYSSTNHAKIYRVDEQWVVEDLNSTNGTWLSKTRISRPTVLPVDMPLRVGRTVMQVRK
ncbi:MAG: FHA domain-containing protein [Actinomycetia bacterium]|nr:FHA domain-containing protein [Actinomycetes bacterium]